MGNDNGGIGRKKKNTIHACWLAAWSLISLAQIGNMKKTKSRRIVVAVVVVARQAAKQPEKGTQKLDSAALTSRPWRSLKPCAFEVLIARVPSASLIPRGVGIATVVCRWRRRRTVHRHASSSTRHHGHRAAAVLQHCHLRVCRHDLHHALFAFLLLLALSCLHTLAAFALALLDLLDFTPVIMLVSFSKRFLFLQSSHRDDIPLFVHSFPFRKCSLDT